MNLIVCLYFLQDEKLLPSVKLTDRVKLWEQYTGPINQDAIKVKFLKRIHRKNPPFKFKVNHPRKNKIRVSGSDLIVIAVRHR